MGQGLLGFRAEQSELSLHEQGSFAASCGPDQIFLDVGRVI